MRILVFGASGRTGRLVVELAVRRGHDVTAFVRDASKSCFPDAVTVRQGDPHDADAVGDALIGQDAVVSALGPIAGVTATEVSDATSTIVRAMERTGPSRIVIATNTTVLADDVVTDGLANVAAEHRRDLEILRRSSLDWTVVAATLLTDDPPSGYEAAIAGGGPLHPIERADFAAALLDALDREAWIGRVVVASGTG